MKQHTYIAIDLKSFYASVECHERNLDPITTNLVVADPSRTEKTIEFDTAYSLEKAMPHVWYRLFTLIEPLYP